MFVFIMDNECYISSIDPRTTDTAQLEDNAVKCSFGTLSSQFALQPISNVLVAAGVTVTMLGDDW